MKTKLFA